MYENYRKIRDLRGFKDSDIAKLSGITKSTFSDWKNGRSNPKNEKLIKIANCLDVTLEELINGIQQNSKSRNKSFFNQIQTLSTRSDAADDYLNDDSKEAAQFLFENPDYKVLFDATRKVKPEDIQFVKEMIDRMTNK